MNSSVPGRLSYAQAIDLLFVAQVKALSQGIIDSMALKSIFPNGGMLTKTGHQAGSSDHAGLVLSESFQRDRQVAITKDMLTGHWSGRIHNRGSVGPHSESVFQPSHFSASQERRVRKAAKAAAAAACPDRETSSISSREGSSSGDSLVFEQAHEDVWGKQLDQVSPSRTSHRKAIAASCCKKRRITLQ